ncbi:Peptidase S28 family-containing protein [Aphelenchoides fujianensis]|nr:Peptidase S28 family-containing protein [Aphelenchoides fujianensis]
MPVGSKQQRKLEGRWIARLPFFLTFAAIVSSAAAADSRSATSSKRADSPPIRAPPRHFSTILWGRERRLGRAGVTPDDETKCPGSNQPVAVKYMEQPLDHFASTDKKWQQHYQVNDIYFDNKTDGAVVFLMIGGEGPIGNKWVCNENLTYMVAANKYKARVIQVEHRFFGANKDMPDLSTDNLQYLTTEQAVADLYSFIDGYNKQEKLTNPKYVAFGGSYPGTMAAWLRLAYPNATQGNIASSAPLYPVVDFWQYADVMQRTLKAAGDDCATAVQTAFATLRSSSLTEDGRSQISSSFQLTTPLKSSTALEDDLNNVKSAIFSSFQGIIQYTYDGRSEDTKKGKTQTVENLCNIMKGSDTDLVKLYKIYAIENQYDNGTVIPFDPSYANSIAALKQTSYDSDAAADRGWLWLSCNEFGWLQGTTNNGIFGDVVPLDFLKKICNDIFDNKMDAGTIDQRVRKTLDTLGYPWKYNGTNVVLPNGDLDPWSSLGTNVTNKDTHTFSQITAGTAHCSDMYAFYDGEPASLADTRKLVWDQIDFFLSQESTWKTSAAAGVSTLQSALLFALVGSFLYNWN